MKICIDLNDRLLLENEVIKAITADGEQKFHISEVKMALIITTDLGPFYDDMGLALHIDKETAIFIMSSHPDYQTFCLTNLENRLKLTMTKSLKLQLVQKIKFLKYIKKRCKI